MQTWKLYLMFAIGPLEMVSKVLAAKDANTTGPDDRAATFLHYASLACQAIANDQDIPPLPAALKTTEPNTKG